MNYHNSTETELSGVELSDVELSDVEPQPVNKAAPLKENAKLNNSNNVFFILFPPYYLFLITM